MNYGAVVRTAPATPGISKRPKLNNSFRILPGGLQIIIVFGLYGFVSNNPEYIRIGSPPREIRTQRT